MLTKHVNHCAHFPVISWTTNNMGTYVFIGAYLEMGAINYSGITLVVVA